MSDSFDRDNFSLPVARGSCSSCSCAFGYVVETNGQDVVRCRGCHKFLYNAPRTETGREQRSVTTIHNGIKPKQRSRVIERALGRCERCKRDDGVLHVGHMISVAIGLTFGLTELELNNDENLMCLCEECNLGMGVEPISLRMAQAILRARLAFAQHERLKEKSGA